MNLDTVISNVNISALLDRSCVEWQNVLSIECQVYVFEEGYLAKRFDSINFKFCDKATAKDILVDNLYALLRFKYFTKRNEEIDEKIERIIKSFVTNIKTVLIKVSFNEESTAKIIRFLPDGCIAFRNGVFNFVENKWLFKYNIYTLDKLSNNIYLYDPTYVIMWYFDYDFDEEMFNFDFLKMNDREFVDYMKTYCKTNENYCFKLAYNMCHDKSRLFNLDKFIHMEEILGYCLLQSFSQHFVLLIGTGQNGKNSLIDGCFTNRLYPKPAANDMDSLEKDRFVTGSLENKSHNIFLESSAKSYEESKMIKALTGSMYQTIEQKGISKYSGIINCKYMFAGNAIDDIKFEDSTVGFRRRINVFEIDYRWDSKKDYLKNSDCYETSFSDSLMELKSDLNNTNVLIVMGIRGILSGTNNLKHNFGFTKNDWSEHYKVINAPLQERINALTVEDIIRHMKANPDNYENCKKLFISINHCKMFNERTLASVKDYESFMEFLANHELLNEYFSEYDCYIQIKEFQKICGFFDSVRSFTNEVKKIYGVQETFSLIDNKSFFKCNLMKGKIHILQK